MCSPGTEISSLNSIKKNILKKIFEKPQVLKNLIDVLKKKGALKILVELYLEN